METQQPQVTNGVSGNGAAKKPQAVGAESPGNSTIAPPPSKRKKILSAIAVVAIVVAAYMIYKGMYFVSTDNAQIQGKTVMLAAKVPGYVTQVNVAENQKVKAGTVLAQIDGRDYQNMLHQMELETESLQARVRDSERNFKRISELFSKGAVSQQQRDSAEASYRETARKIQSLETQVSQARLNVSYTEIKAPSDGVVARKSVEVGMLAPVGTPLFGFVSSEERWVVANFKETEIPEIQPGRVVDIEVDALPGRKFHGKVESLSPATGATFTLLPPDNATGNFTKVVQRVPVRIQLENLSARDIDSLQAGLSANVTVHIR